MPKRWLAMAAVAAWTLLSAAPALPQTPPAEVLAAARDLCVIMEVRQDEQYKALVAMRVQALLKPTIVQGRPQVERDFDAITSILLSGLQSRFEEINESVVGIYARNFTAAELREIIAFFGGPTARKLEQKGRIIDKATVAEQKSGARVGQEELRARMIGEFTADELREIEAFHRGPTGQKFLQKVPILAQETIAVTYTLVDKAYEEIKGRTIEELRKKGHKL